MARSVTEEESALADACAAAVDVEREAWLCVEDAQTELLEATIRYNDARIARVAADRAEYVYYGRMD